MTLLDSRLPYIIQASLVNVFHLLQWTHNLSRTLGIWLPWWLSNKEYCCQCKRCIRHRFSLWVGKIPWRRKWQPTPVSFSGKFHGQRSPVGYSPWGHKESNMTEHMYFWYSLLNTALFLLVVLESSAVSSLGLSPFPKNTCSDIWFCFLLSLARVSIWAIPWENKCGKGNEDCDVQPNSKSEELFSAQEAHTSY